MTVTYIEESQDISTIKLDEIIGSLLTFDKINKGITFKANINNDD